MSFIAFIDLPEMISHMKQNYETWKEYRVFDFCLLTIEIDNLITNKICLIFFFSVGMWNLDSARRRKTATITGTTNNTSIYLIVTSHLHQFY